MTTQVILLVETFLPDPVRSDNFLPVTVTSQTLGETLTTQVILDA